MIGTRWAVACVRTGDEVETAQRLTGAGLDIWCPRYKTTINSGAMRRPKRIVKALLPSYLFVDWDSIVDLEAVHEIPGFRRFLRNQGGVSLLRADAIEGLRLMERQGIALPTDIETLVDQWNVGDLVRGAAGVIGGMRGYVVEVMEGRYRVDHLDFKKPMDVPGLLLVGDRL